MPKKKYRPEQIVTLLGQIELSYKTDTSSSTEILASRGILRSVPKAASSWRGTATAWRCASVWWRKRTWLPFWRTGW